MYDVLEKNPNGLGKPLEGEWAGCCGERVGHLEKYRVIWELLNPEEDYDGRPGDLVIPILVLRAWKKRPAAGGTIYDQPRPERPT